MGWGGGGKREGEREEGRLLGLKKVKEQSSIASVFDRRAAARRKKAVAVAAFRSCFY